MATPAEERSDETPQELATRRLSASSAESVRLMRRIPHKYETMNYYSFVYKLGGMFFLKFVRKMIQLLCYGRYTVSTKKLH